MKNKEEKLEESKIITKMLEDIELKINNKYEVNGEYFDTEEEAKDELSKLKKVLASSGYKVLFYSRLGFSIEKTAVYFVVRLDEVKFSPVTNITGEDILNTYLMYHYGSPLGLDEVNNGVIKKYEIVESDKKEIKEKLESDKSKVKILDSLDIEESIKIISNKLKS